MQRIKAFFQKEVVLSVALLLAIISMFFVTPDKAYLEYIDFRTLGILFCLMVVMAGFQEVGVFQRIGWLLVEKVKSSTQLMLILIGLCFFSSMLITNDVALITFVPFTFVVFGILGEKKERAHLIPLIGLETIAANLGSMLTPIGNPQNLYLYGKSGLGLMEFIGMMLPYTTLSFVLLVGMSILYGRKDKEGIQIEKKVISLKEKRVAIVRYVVLFLLSLCCVANLLPFQVVLGVILVTTLIMDRSLLKKVDYSLLLTFVGFFVFIGNMGRVEAFHQLLSKIVSGNEVITAVLSSQVISNVPAALLLSGFTEDYCGLVVGTNLGGLGTLIASMASLISYKYIAGNGKCKKSTYLFFFTWTNLLFLAILLGFWRIL